VSQHDSAIESGGDPTRAQPLDPAAHAIVGFELSDGRARYRFISQKPSDVYPVEEIVDAANMVFVVVGDREHIELENILALQI
jgi:hypothetical protein